MDVTKYSSLKEKILAESQIESKFRQHYRDYRRTPYEVYDAEGRIKNGYGKGIVGRIDIDYYTFEYTLPTILHYLRNCYVSYVRLDFGFYAVSGRICQRIVELLDHTNVISEAFHFNCKKCIRISPSLVINLCEAFHPRSICNIAAFQNDCSFLNDDLLQYSNLKKCEHLFVE
ncbi:hypothetical protein DdX_02911 [Ditylenchus destructor]|uniref:Uncharacterized protein n=1 Tax=Ditylenchus destructor TaxID=166010 RepID=A0AAD4NFA7_9BILA|nr:hypothetical protein DdX_02911 [Ditylenchus destructor]